MGKALVAYFSASGITAGLAQKLAAAIGADLYEIKPEVAYTRADLDWTNKASRSSVEMNDPSSRPAVSGRVENMEQYDIIFAGFPIWWYTAPTIVNTFLEGYDLSGKTVVPFATSGGSGMEKVNASLAGSCKGAVLKDGRRFSPSIGKTDLRNWAEDFGI